jgi:LCP family protein required for cell wall assembly
VAPKRRNQWRALAMRVAIALVASSFLAGVGFAASHKVSDDILDDTTDISFGSNVLTDPDLDDEATDPTNFLIVGSDSRSDQGDAFGDVDGQRSDTIMVVHADPRAKTAVVVSFPRDLIVDVPGRGREMINSAFNADLGGGPELLVQTITENFGIDISHYLEVDFAGFARIVDTIGRVEIFFPVPARDRYTGLAIMYPGCAKLDGADALRYVRSRHYQYVDYSDDPDGEWRTDGTSDFGRIRRQQYFIRSLMQQALERTQRQPIKMFSLVDSLSDMITIDSGVNVEDVKKLTRAFINSDPGAVEMYTVPVQSGEGGLVLREEEAAPLFAKLALVPPTLPVVDLSAFSVDVLNGGAPGSAAQTALGELAAIGFTRGRVGDTDAVARTELRYVGERGRAAAEFVKLYLGGVGVPVEVDSTGSEADVVVVLGADFVEVRDPGVAPTTVPTESTGPTTTATTIAPNPGSAPEGEGFQTGEQTVGCG